MSGNSTGVCDRDSPRDDFLDGLLIHFRGGLRESRHPNGARDHLPEERAFTLVFHLFLPLRCRNVGCYLEIGERIEIDGEFCVCRFHFKSAFLTNLSRIRLIQDEMS